MVEQGTPVTERKFEGDYLRPSFIEPFRCQNVLIEGVRIVRSPMWELHPVLSTNLTVRGVHIETHGPNNDGCDPEACRDVLIEDCVFDTGDDCIAIKSGRNNDGRRIGLPTENVVIRRCTMKDGHGGVTIGERDLWLPQCVRGGLHDGQSEPRSRVALQIKTPSAGRGGECFRAQHQGRHSGRCGVAD